MLTKTIRRLPKAVYNPGDKTEIKPEAPIDDIQFTVHKFTNRPKPDKSRVVIFPAFSEFGCESLIPLYCIPQLMRTKYQGSYSIVMGWYGREYLYRHLVDEYWELNEEFQHLREYCRAFHHHSKNLQKLEKQVEEHGKIVSAIRIGQVMVYPRLMECPVKYDQVDCPGRVSQFREHQQCLKCGAQFPPVGLIDDAVASQKRAVWLPPPVEEKIAKARKYLPPKAVGVTARGRKCYGRNLTPEFYERLIWLLENMGYNPVWLGEKVTTQPCPCPRIPDFSRREDARDFEFTLALVSQMEFTVQFWTASTRLAGLVGTPFLLFESPDQIWGNGHEGYRLQLTSRGPKKLVVAHFLNVLDNNTKALRVVEAAISEMEKGDYSTMIGLPQDESAVRSMIRSARNRISWF